MLKISVPAVELYDDIRNEFIDVKGQTLTLEHSLVSISKWESKWKRPFFKDPPKTAEELQDYVRCMTLTQNVDPNVYRAIPGDVYTQITDYMNDSMTATWFSERNQRRNTRIITSELIYCWMFQLGIPMECQKWHINRLMTLIRVCSEETREPQKMSRKDMAALNNARRKARRKR